MPINRLERTRASLRYQFGDARVDGRAERPSLSGGDREPSASYGMNQRWCEQLARRVAESLPRAIVAPEGRPDWFVSGLIGPPDFADEAIAITALQAHIGARHVGRYFVPEVPRDREAFEHVVIVNEPHVSLRLARYWDLERSCMVTRVWVAGSSS